MATATFSGFPPAGLAFLGGLQANNNKTWFDAHRADYDTSLIAPARQFVVDLGARLQDQISPRIHAEPRTGGSLMRINRDTRFSKDKSPYKDYLGLWFWEGGDGPSMDHPGYYLALAGDHVTIGAGKHGFEKEALDRYRAAVVDKERGPVLSEALDSIRAAGPYEIGGEHYKQVPRGFDPHHERAALLKHAGLHAGITVPTPSEIHSAAFVDYCLAHYRHLAPIVHWLADL